MPHTGCRLPPCGQPPGTGWLRVAPLGSMLQKPGDLPGAVLHASIRERVHGVRQGRTGTIQ